MNYLQKAAANKQRAEPRVMLSAKIPLSIHQQLLVASERTGKSMTSIVVEGVKMYFAENLGEVDGE